MSPSERLILTLTHKTLRAYYHDRLVIRLLGICVDVKMNCGEISCEDESWMKLAEGCRALCEGLWH
jgi:hypothetical protein